MTHSIERCAERSVGQLEAAKELDEDAHTDDKGEAPSSDEVRLQHISYETIFVIMSHRSLYHMIYYSASVIISHDLLFLVGHYTT